MPAPFYISHEQVLQDKQEFAERGIAQGKDVIAIEYADGIAIVAPNPHRSLNKISEIYDRIAFAAVGKYSEFEPLRIYGIREAETRGLMFSREDVQAKSLANFYSLYIDSVYRQFDAKVLETELLLVEVGDDNGSPNAIYHIYYDGRLGEEKQFAVIGGHAQELHEKLQQQFREQMPLNEAVKLATQLLSDLEEEAITPDELEIALLDKKRPRRKFRRLTPEEIAEILAS